MSDIYVINIQIQKCSYISSMIELPFKVYDLIKCFLYFGYTSISFTCRSVEAELTNSLCEEFRKKEDSAKELY